MRPVRLAVAVALLAYGCQSKSCSRCSRSRSADVADARSNKDPNIDILGRGSEPRVTLRVARWTGLKYRTTLTVDASVMAQGSPSPPSPTVRAVFLYEVTRGTADPLVLGVDGGESVSVIEERAVLESISIKNDLAPPPDVIAFNQALTALQGTTVVQRIADNGGVVELKTELVGGRQPPPEVRAASDAALDIQRRFPFRLPPVSVGAGAKWRFREEMEVNKVRGIQVADMVLRSFDGNTAVVHIRVRQEAPRQEVPHPLDPADTAMLEQLRGDGDGELVIDRNTGIPLKGRLATTARMTVSGDVAGEPQRVTFIAASVIQSSSVILDEATDPEAGAPPSAPQNSE